MKILNGKELAGFIKERQARQVKLLNKTPKLLIVRDNDSPVIEKYIELKKRYGEDIGVLVEDFYTKNFDELVKKIQSGNNDPEIDGIILQLPILEKEKTDELTAYINSEKDVDGLSDSDDAYDSATATAILWLLTGYDIDLKNKSIALVGRGKLVGAPLYKMFKNSNFNVKMFHRGDDLSELKNFEVIITATGVPELITNDMVSAGTVVVDAGTASEKGILKGDVADEIRDRKDLAAITPIIGGVGPLTVTCLFDHVIQSASKK